MVKLVRYLSSEQFFYQKKACTCDVAFHTVYWLTYTIPAPTSPTEITAQFQWSCSVHKCFSGANCFSNICVIYHAEGNSESLSDPAATEVTLTDLQCKCYTNYTITVMAIAGVHALEEECSTFFHYV